MVERKVTLEEMLNCREKRVERQRQALSRFGVPLISITLVWPGEAKDTEVSRYVMEHALKALDHALDVQKVRPVQQWHDFLFTGPEAIYSVAMDAIELKLLCVEVEARHPLGRLWDIDVINKDGRPVSRSEIGLPPRRCLLCNAHAHICARSRIHGVNELLNVINRRINEFKNGE